MEDENSHSTNIKYMKVNFLVALIAITILSSLSACNKVKDWQCECTANGDIVFQEVLPAKKGNAKDMCQAFEKTFSSQNAKCKLK